ncbi:hypothetical protein J2X47_001947 [Sphingomonas sp. BE270]|jgi:hypothetical protein|uniref:hypothetical protein n=1 Tax=Sphingomonas sp. BE270 TaxID=2817726 RepID=UPI002863DD57|nr:hypothetical protein [Sphingomonas sp. BE270]MDR7257767.1 hypothetical protein [Sphingomonas sp. BE270]
MTGQRTLSDADVSAIVDGLEKRITEKFYRDIGKGIWGLLWKAILSAALIIAAYGAMSNGKG